MFNLMPLFANRGMGRRLNGNESEDLPVDCVIAFGWKGKNNSNLFLQILLIACIKRKMK
jgi:hypothetical protein